ncbi:MAG: hypothetical protein WCY78_07560 [Sphaerochaetaceae bacterium]
MSVSDIRQRSQLRREEEIERLERSLTKLREKHEELKQALFDTGKRLQGSPDSSLLVRETEHLKQTISDTVVDIRALDARLHRLKNRAKRSSRNG